MRIKGQLEEKIKNGNAVLFFGAGFGQSIGLKGTIQLSNYLFEMAKSPHQYLQYKDQFDQLVARFDKDPSFQRQWTNDKLCAYFNNPLNYNNLELGKKFLNYSWQAFFTTNYDISIELSYEQMPYTSINQRLIPVTNPNEIKIIQDRDSKRLKYFKLHGCCRDIEHNPSDSERLVITAKDFAESSFRNKNILQEFVSLSYNVPIVFIGFNIHRNSRLLDSVYEVHKYLSDTTQQQFSNFFAILPNVDADSRFELEELNINIIEGTAEEFISEVERIHGDERNDAKYNIEKIQNISFTFFAGQKHVLQIPTSEYNKNCEQFIGYHDSYFQEKKLQFESLSRLEIVDAWKSQPSDMFIFSNRCVQREQHNAIFDEIKGRIEKIRGSRNLDPTYKESPNNLILWGERGCGKSVLIRQVCRQIYEELGSPILFLRENSMYVENNDGKEMILSGWNGRAFDKFLSHFLSEANGLTSVPLIIADHVAHMLYAIKNLHKHLVNHGKEVILILVLNESDFLRQRESDPTDIDQQNREYRNYTAIKINHLLGDTEIQRLFDSVKIDNLRINEFRPELIAKAKAPEFGKKDLLFILYMWFDKNFRRLEDIILDEAEKINANTAIKDLYLSIAVFQQYNLEPRLDLCAIAIGISEKQFSELKADPLFQSLIKLRKHDFFFESFALSRHSQFTRKLLNELLIGTADQKIEIEVQLIEKVLHEIRPIDLDFVRALFVRLYDAKVYSPSDIIRLKQASEAKDFFKKDFIINHQFAAYLIRENAQEHFTTVRYYLDMALDTAPPSGQSAIMHSNGHLEFKRYLNTDKLEHFNKAKDFFERVRSKSIIPDEPDYVTEVDMITERILKEKDSEVKALLTAERTALITEAMSVVAPERQNYILNRQQFIIPFKELSKEDRRNILQIINSGKAPHTILKYYIESLISQKSRENWKKVKEVILTYYNYKSPLATLIILSSFTKICFVISAEERFEFLRKLFNDVVKDKESKLSFILVAEYQRILIMDAFVLRKFDFVKASMEDYRATYKNSFPSYQKDEYLLPSQYYSFSKESEEILINRFIDNSEDFYSYKLAQRYEKQVYIEKNRTDHYFHIVMDHYTKFYIRGIKREIGGDSQSRITLDFCIRFGLDGFRAADVRRVA